MIFSVFQKNGFLGILGPPYCGIGATIHIGREMLCLPYAEFFQHMFLRKMFKQSFLIVQTNLFLESLLVNDIQPWILLHRLIGAYPSIHHDLAATMESF